jgi:Zn-dependent protease
LRGGSFRLFQVAGITVYLHLTWFLVAWYQIDSGRYRFRRPLWAAIEYIGLFGIVLLHEFGHAFACRSTGGKADRIVLWPLGGLAFVDPPLRASAVLWSIVAGPLVNVVLYPFLQVALIATGRHGFFPISPDAHRVLLDLWTLNIFILLFNLLPFYPLDGGQIVRALLWFKFGPIRSLFMAGGLGVLGAVLLGIWAVTTSSIWTGVLAFFLLSQAYAAVARAQAMSKEVTVTRDLESKPPAASTMPIDEEPR